MLIKVFTQKNIKDLNWESVKKGELLKAYYLPLVKNGSNIYVKNSNHLIHILQVDNQVYPISLAKKSKKGTCYLFSFLSQYIDYTREEILSNDKYSSLQKRTVQFLFPLLKPLGIFTGLENVVFINNLFLATNLYEEPSLLTNNHVTEYLKSYYNNKTIAFRSVNDSTDLEMLENLKETGAIPLVCRQLYILNPKDERYKKKRPVVQDRKLWEKTENLYWEKISGFKRNENEIALKYYEDLYLKKYSILNPYFTSEFLTNTLKSGLLDYYFLREKTSDLPLAVQAIERTSSVVCTPFIGYDQKKPKEVGLYRLMNRQLTELAVKGNKTLNMSSGASDFKKQRGGLPCFDYNVVLCDHLPKRKQWIWKKIFSYSETVIKPAMLELAI